MASFRIHEDQENTAAASRKDGDAFATAAAQRRALGDLGQFACNQNRNSKFTALPHGQISQVHDENKYVRQINNEKNIAPPVAQFRAFSVYEDKPTEWEQKKKEPVFKPFSTVELRRPTEISRLESAKLAPSVEKIEQSKEVHHLDFKLEEKVQDADVQSPMSVTQDTSVLSVMSVSRNESQLEDVEEESEEEGEEATVAQTDREMFFHVVEYRDDIYQYMREIEVKHRPHPRYMRKQHDISHSMRSILVDWLCEVCEEYSQQSETLHLAVSYVDRFLSFMSVVRGKLQLVGTAATFIASKYEEVYPPEVAEFAYITDNTYTKREVLRMEHLILKVLSFDLSTPTALAFLSHYCISNALSKKTFHLASYISELSLLEADPYLQFKPSLIAAAALATARHCLLCIACSGRETPVLEDTPHPDCLKTAWSASLALSSGYELRELEVCMRQLARTHSHAPLQPRRAIPDKYHSNKFDSVSSIAARPIYPVPAAPAIPPPEPVVASPAAPVAATPPAASVAATPHATTPATACPTSQTQCVS